MSKYTKQDALRVFLVATDEMIEGSYSDVICVSYDDIEGYIDDSQEYDESIEGQREKIFDALDELEKHMLLNWLDEMFEEIPDWVYKFYVKNQKEFNEAYTNCHYGTISDREDVRGTLRQSCEERGIIL